MTREEMKTTLILLGYECRLSRVFYDEYENANSYIRVHDTGTTSFIHYVTGEHKMLPFTYEELLKHLVTIL